MANESAWIVDDDRSIRIVLATAFRDAGLSVCEFADGESMLAALAKGTPQVLFTDVRMDGVSGFDLLERIAKMPKRFPVIVMSAYTDVASTSAAYRLGAFDYLPKPFDLDAAVDMAQRAVQQRPTHESEEVASTANPVEDAELVGRSAPMRELFRSIGRAAASGLSVLITGETGTGKELVAHALHRESTRAGKPFIAMNAGAVPSELLESELFGHEAGAFTGALRRHAGRFEQATGGTLFLDEIGDMPLALQTRLLRVLAAGEFYRVGGRELLRADVRILAATHQDLDAKAATGQFRADLLHRLDVIRIHLPALRERRDDVALLASHFLARAAAETGIERKRFSTESMAMLREHNWPGNVRQLHNLCRRVNALAAGRDVDVADLHKVLRRDAKPMPDGDWTVELRHWADATFASGRGDIHGVATASLERVLFDAALDFHENHRQNAAHQLGVSRNTLTRKLGSSRRRRSE
ncbi:MAG: nitrogen regulation protein NR(I) [Dokdonella sp.]